MSDLEASPERATGTPEMDDANATAGSPPPTGQDRNIKERWVEGISVVLLAIASVTAAWCGYQATLWGGEQSAHYAEAGARRVESARASGLATQLTQVDVSVLIQWVNADQSGDQELADFYESRFSDVLRPAFDAWIALDPFNNPDAPNAPFSMPEYQQPNLVLANDLESQAAALFDQGQTDNKNGDDYVLATVFLATALFFLAVSAGLNWFPARVALSSVGGAMVVTALVYLLTLPVAG
jgi:hypothetical protein